jgi:hypothetical protein
VGRAPTHNHTVAAADDNSEPGGVNVWANYPVVYF